MFSKSLNHNYSLHTQRVFTQDWLNSFWTSASCSVLPFLSHGKQSNECTWRRMSLPSKHLYKCKQVACSVIVACLFVSPFFVVLQFVVACLLLNLFFILMLLPYFCLFVDHVNKSIIFAFGAFVYHFCNNIMTNRVEYSHFMQVITFWSPNVL